MGILAELIYLFFLILIDTRLINKYTDYRIVIILVSFLISILCGGLCVKFLSTKKNKELMIAGSAMISGLILGLLFEYH